MGGLLLPAVMLERKRRAKDGAENRKQKTGKRQLLWAVHAGSSSWAWGVFIGGRTADGRVMHPTPWWA